MPRPGKLPRRCRRRTSGRNRSPRAGRLAFGAPYQVRRYGVRGPGIRGERRSSDPALCPLHSEHYDHDRSDPGEPNSRVANGSGAEPVLRAFAGHDVHRRQRRLLQVPQSPVGRDAGLVHQGTPIQTVYRLRTSGRRREYFGGAGPAQHGSANPRIPEPPPL